MTNRQNALEIIHFGKPEKVLAEIPVHTAEYFGMNHQSLEDTGIRDGHNKPVGSRWIDIWGTEWHKEFAGVMGFPKGNPLADMDRFASYKWPDPNDERFCRQIYEDAENCKPNADKLLCGSHRDTLWEKAYMLVGMENMMVYFYTDPAYAREILHHIMDFQLGIARHYIRAGVEIVSLGDDLGTQNSLILSPEILNEFLIPEYMRLFDFYRSRNILINFHSCGHVAPLLETFIAMGVNILNPLQATANDLCRVIAVTEGRMALCGGISTGLIMDGPIDQIRQTVKETIGLLGKNGGYFCMPDQTMPFPKENIQAFYQAVEEFGSYPRRTE